ncbi:MAG: hypothetical protein Q9193_000767 [Seirophora villosa]
MASNIAPETPRCAKCFKFHPSLPQPVQRCGNCSTVRYCSVGCQTADWRPYKSWWPRSGYTSPASMSPAGAMLDTAFGGNNLDTLTETDCYIRLIDSYRMRVEDDFTFAGDNHGLYALKDRALDFAYFLDLAEKRKDLLPKWWSEETRAACEAMASDDSKHSCTDLSSVVEKPDLGPNKVNAKATKLRLLAEKVYGKRVHDRHPRESDRRR